MHNSKKANLEFRIAFTETNIRYLRGSKKTREIKDQLKYMWKALEEAKLALASEK